MPSSSVPGHYNVAVCLVLAVLLHLLRTEGNRSLYWLQLPLCGFVLLDEIIFTVKISAVQWHDKYAANSGISSDLQNASARLLLTTL